MYKYFTVLALSIVVLLGCSTRAKFTPRSELIKEAKSSGAEILTIEQENARFKFYEEQQKERLLTLVKQRYEARGSIDPGYRIGPEDEIEINVFDVEEMNTTVRVRPSGFISLPLVGAVEAKGLTEAELTKEIANRLKDFVREPEVSLFITHYASQKVAVMGAVAKPGTFPLKKDSNSLQELIGQAGGATFRAGSYVNFVPGEFVDNDSSLPVALFNARKVKEKAIEMPIDDVLGTSGNVPIDIPIRGGDMIVVPEAGSVAVEGEVKQPGNYELKNRISLVGGLAAAGGITSGALYEEVELVRRLDNGEKPLRLIVNLEEVASGKSDDVRLRAGDVVRVPSHSGRRFSQDTFESVTRLINFGVGGSVGL